MMGKVGILNVGAGDTPRRRALRKYRKSEKGKKNQERYVATNKGKETRRGIERKYAKANKEKRNAKRAIAYAVRIGRLPKAEKFPCFVCVDVDAAHFHHPSYERSQRYLVTPVCAKCHSLIHRPDAQSAA